MVWVVSLSTVQLIPHGLTAEVINVVFGVWFSEVPREGPPSNSVSLPPHHSLLDAIPKDISQRTSYLQV